MNYEARRPTRESKLIWKIVWKWGILVFSTKIMIIMNITKEPTTFSLFTFLVSFNMIYLSESDIIKILNIFS